MKRILYVILLTTTISFINSCVTQKQIQEAHTKGGHPIGKHDRKVHRWEK